MTHDDSVGASQPMDDGRVPLSSKGTRRKALTGAERVAAAAAAVKHYAAGRSITNTAAAIEQSYATTRALLVEGGVTIRPREWTPLARELALRAIENKRGPSQEERSAMTHCHAPGITDASKPCGAELQWVGRKWSTTCLGCGSHVWLKPKRLWCVYSD